MAQSIFTPLYLANYFVDQVQDAKTKVVDTFVWDDKVKKTAKDFVEAQRTYTKQFNTSVNQFIEYSTIATKDTIEKAVSAIKV